MKSLDMLSVIVCLFIRWSVRFVRVCVRGYVSRCRRDYREQELVELRSSHSSVRMLSRGIGVSKNNTLGA